MSVPLPAPSTSTVSGPASVDAAQHPTGVPLRPADDPHAVVPAPSQRTAEYHRLARLLGHRRLWWRPLLALVLVGVFSAVLMFLLLVPLVLLGLAVPALAPSADLSDPRNPVDMLLMLGMIALMLPAVLLAGRIAYGRSGIAHSITGRMRWSLMRRAALVVVPLYLLLNTGGTLLGERGALDVPGLSAAVVAAFVLIIVMVPVQAAAEEYAFRALPMQMMGTWLRSPLWGILLPVPLFMLGHGYDWVGQIDLAVFSLAAGLLAWKTGGLELPILLHVANNWTLFLVAPLLPGALDQGAVPPAALLTSTLPTILITAGLWWWFSRREGLRLREPARGGGSASAWSAGARP